MPSVRDDLLVLCGEKIADPLTTADQYDLARALSQAENYGQTCSKRQAELVGAVKTRQATVKAIKKNLEK